METPATHRTEVLRSLYTRFPDTDDSHADLNGGDLVDWLLEDGLPLLKRHDALHAAALDLRNALLVSENLIRKRQMYETHGSGEHQQLSWVLAVIHDALGQAA